MILPLEAGCITNSSPSLETRYRISNYLHKTSNISELWVLTKLSIFPECRGPEDANILKCELPPLDSHA